LLIFGLLTYLLTYFCPSLSSSSIYSLFISSLFSYFPIKGLVDTQPTPQKKHALVHKIYEKVLYIFVCIEAECLIKLLALTAEEQHPGIGPLFKCLK
jgi:hypothetical protein